MLGISIKNNINMPIYERNSTLGVIHSKKEMEVAQRYKEILPSKPFAASAGENLSGGNQQKVILARWMAANSQLVIFDEPTRGIDVGAKYEIYKLMNELVEKEGKTILLISSEMEELMGMSDRIIVLAEGKMTGELEKGEFDQSTIMAFASAAEIKEV
ncbi:ATP-binding cassette domain-containing protein [Suipraeoptans intestinalis]|uniref:ATP-binding cassette domain-containing protein n=1 Tax=Suipraeoptans intestinalis TaxID=2606628 RepID=UPI003A7F4AF5